MKQYPKLHYWKPEQLGKEIWAQDKLDGQNLRFEGNLKRGFYKFGTRTQMISVDDPTFGLGWNLFCEKYSDAILSHLSKFLKSKTDKFTVFAELVGENSFAGKHNPEDKLDVILFDIWIFKKGWLLPLELEERFGHIGTPKIIYKGEFNMDFVKDIQENIYQLKEGVIIKGIEGKEVFMNKVKTKEWLERVKTELGVGALMEDIDYDPKNLII